MMPHLLDSPVLQTGRLQVTDDILVYKQDINPSSKHQDVSTSGFPLFAAGLAY